MGSKTPPWNGNLASNPLRERSFYRKVLDCFVGTVYQGVSATKLPRVARSSFATPYSSPYEREAVHVLFSQQQKIVKQFSNTKTHLYLTSVF